MRLATLADSGAVELQRMAPARALATHVVGTMFGRWRRARDAGGEVGRAKERGPVEMEAPTARQSQQPLLTTTLGRLQLKNPILAASGTVGFGREMSLHYHLALLGGLVTKTVTLRPRQGNPPPRVAETPAGMLNSIGLANPGLEGFLKTELPFLSRFDTVRIVNIAGDTPDEYVELAERLSAEALVDALELNVSCPNVERGGVNFGSSPEVLTELVGRVRRATQQPLLVKLTPNVTDIVVTARAAVEAGADVLTVANTHLGLVVDWRNRQPLLGGVTGGLSGPAIKPLNLRAVWQVTRALSVPVIGVGGITTVDDVMEYLVAGARAVAVGTANFLNPLAIPELLEQLVEVLNREGIERVEDIVGTLKVASRQERG
jgi:dihydroorotate dehydrogenase (NAD+) catalytic subunit